MINGNVNEFIDHTSYEECALLFQGKKYFFHGIVFDKKEKKYSYNIALWDDDGCFVDYIFNETADTELEIMEKFYTAAIWDNKTFWEKESEMEWIDW